MRSETSMLDLIFGQLGVDDIDLRRSSSSKFGYPCSALYKPSDFFYKIF